jgi:cysteine desulfurase / selenocysteine lyase
LEIDRAGRAHTKKIVSDDLVGSEETRRREFPICRRKIYCAHAADAPLPRRVADAMRESIERASNNERQSELELEDIAKTRDAVALFLGAAPEEISFTGPTSAGLSVVANGLDWHTGDEVVCYLEDYPANVYPWIALEQRGVKIVLIETAVLGRITPETVEQALTKRTKLVALSTANNCSGYRIDLEAIGALCSERGILFCVDAIQTLGVFPVPLNHIDFLSAGAQKWMLGPSGAGILFVKKSRRDLLRPPIVGGWNVQSPNFIAQRHIRYANGGQKFEPGAYTHSVIAGLRAAVELLSAVGSPAIATKVLSLTSALRGQLESSAFEFLSPTPEQNRSGILTFGHPKLPTERLARRLSENDVVASLRFDRAGRSWLRVSPHFYNTPGELERVAQLLNSAAGV